MVRGLWNAVPESRDVPSPLGNGHFLVDEVGALVAVCLPREEANLCVSLCSPTLANPWLNERVVAV